MSGDGEVAKHPEREAGDLGLSWLLAVDPGTDHSTQEASEASFAEEQVL